MPKVDIMSKSGSSKMPELKKPKRKPKEKSTNHNANHFHKKASSNITKITTAEKIETPNSTEIRTETILFEDPKNSQDLKKEQPQEQLKTTNLEEPEIIENLDDFTNEIENEKEEKFDMEINQEKPTKKFKKKKSEKVFRIISKVILGLFTISGIIVLFSVLSIGVLPEKYIPLLVCVFVFLLILFSVFTFPKRFKKVSKSICMFFELVFVIIFGVAFYYIGITTGFLSGIMAGNYQIEEYLVIVKTDSGFEKSEDLNGKTIATYTDISENYQKALDEFSKKSSAEKISHTDFSDASFALLNDETEALLLKGSLKSTVEEIVNDYNTQNPEAKVPAFNDKNIKVIDKIEIRIAVENASEDNIDLSTEPFNIFISGIDTYGDISLVSRSDVNMIATINPKEHKILLTSIPRDYYVQLHDTVGLKDKLTHAGIYGVDMSRQTIEDLFNTEIRYFARVNFSSVIKIVDAIGGITINSDLPLQLYADGGKTCYYQYGENFVDGTCALRFARERHSYADGDNHRIKNQQEVLDAIIKKVSSSKALVSNYSEFLSALSGNLESNVPTNQIYKLAQAQLSDMPSWTVERITVDGTGAHDFTYSIPSQSLYVMIPNEESVRTAERKIKEFLGIAEPEPEAPEKPTEEIEEITE